jgi:hypothetical protein
MFTSLYLTRGISSDIPPVRKVSADTNQSQGVESSQHSGYAFFSKLSPIVKLTNFRLHTEGRHLSCCDSSQRTDERLELLRARGPPCLELLTSLPDPLKFTLVEHGRLNTTARMSRGIYALLIETVSVFGDLTVLCGLRRLLIKVAQRRAMVVSDPERFSHPQQTIKWPLFARSELFSGFSHFCHIC